MKFKSFLYAAFISAVTLSAVGCNDDDDVTGNGGGPVVEPLKVTLTDENHPTATSLEFTVTPEGEAAKCYYFIQETSAENFPTTADEIVERGVELQEVKTQKVVVSDLQPETRYKVTAALVSTDQKVMARPIEMTTSKEEIPVMEMVDGFLAHDGFDEASGRYRLTIALCDQKIGEQTHPYHDVMIYVYLSEPLKKVDEHHMAVPFGKITPFFTDGSPIGDMVYYIGKHTQGEDGGESFQGTAWILNKSKDEAEYFVASDVQNTSIQIDDLGGRKYKVHGMLVDKELGKKLKFSFIDDKLVYALVSN